MHDSRFIGAESAAACFGNAKLNRSKTKPLKHSNRVGQPAALAFHIAQALKMGCLTRE
jgi:hypothetical protein